MNRSNLRSSECNWYVPLISSDGISVDYSSYGLISRVYNSICAFEPESEVLSASFCMARMKHERHNLIVSQVSGILSVQ